LIGLIQPPKPGDDPDDAWRPLNPGQDQSNKIPKLGAKKSAVTHVCGSDFVLEQSIRLKALLELSEFQAISTFREQVQMACIHLRDLACGSRFTWCGLGRFFGD
jgi:hypothetical protein